jgi:catechol 2,3-dioxygenase-like lactoylglutathione lyase family enzyme
MDSQAAGNPRRPGALAVHSLHRFVFSVPDLGEAAAFYRVFGLDVRETDGHLDLHTFGHPHRWGSIYQGAGPKRFEYVSFGAYADDFDPLVQRLGQLGITTTKPHPLADDQGVWFADPDGTAVEIVVAPKVSPAGRPKASVVAIPPGVGAAPSRSRAGTARPRRLSHILLFTPDVPRSVRFYENALGLRLDRSGDVIAFLHGAHASDHHMLAFAKPMVPPASFMWTWRRRRRRPGMQQMADRGYAHAALSARDRPNYPLRADPGAVSPNFQPTSTPIPADVD